MLDEKFDVLEDENIKLLLKSSLIGALSKTIDIFRYCGYDIERYINNYYNWVDPNDNEFAYSQLFKIVDDNNNIISDNKLEVMKKDHEEEFIKIMKFFESNGLEFDRFPDKKDSYTDYIAFFIDTDKIMNNSAVKNLLLSAIRMHLVDITTINPTKYQNSDYTYLTVNFVKSLERFMFYKLNKISPFNEYDAKHNTFFDLEKKIDDYISNNIKDIPSGLLNQYKELLSKFREVYRNGYFHRDILVREKAYKVNELALILIVLTDLIIK